MSNSKIGDGVFGRGASFKRISHRTIHEVSNLPPVNKKIVFASTRMSLTVPFFFNLKSQVFNFQLGNKMRTFYQGINPHKIFMCFAENRSNQKKLFCPVRTNHPLMIIDLISHPNDLPILFRTIHRKSFQHPTLELLRRQ